MVLGLLLARRGVRVQVLELHGDFERDFRGDTIHPATMEMLDQIGLADDLLKIPHGTLRVMSFVTPDRTWKLVRLDLLKTPFPYIMIAPQARFLAYLHEHARRYPHFALTFRANVHELVEEGGAVKGVLYKDEHDAIHEVRAPLTVAADGRSSRLARLAGFEAESQSPEIDVIWLRLPRRPSDLADEGAVYSAAGQFMVVFERESEWQAGYVVPKGGYKQLREEGIARLQQNVARLVPWLADRVDTLDDWKKTHVLTVKADRLPLWHKPGLLFIGDAAHAMSPVGGVGINYAIGDAAEAANVLSERLREGLPVEEADLAEVQRRRAPVVRKVQRVQALVQERVVGETLRHKNEQVVPPWPIRLVLKTPYLRDIPARMVAFGPRPYRLERVDERPPA